MTSAALRAGYHVLVEKPAAGSVEQVNEMIAARDATGLQCAVGFQQIYSPVIQSLKRRVATGRLGRVRRIRMMALWPRTPAYYARNGWAGRLYCDGQPVFDSPFNNALAHQIMNMLYLATPQPGRAAYATHVEAELYRAYDIESFDTGCMRAVTEDGVELFFAATHACQATVDPKMELEAENAMVHWQLNGDAHIAYADGQTEVIARAEDRIPMFKNVIDAVDGNAPGPLCTLEIARAQVACTRSIHAATSIRSVPDYLVSEVEGGQRVIHGVENAIRQAFDHGSLFSELGVPFARALR